jgi:hypothetical protein
MLLLAGIFHRQGDQDTASRCLDAVIAAPETPPEILCKALAQCAALLDKMGLGEAAEMYYERLIEAFPQAEVAHRAYLRLGRKIPSATVAPSLPVGTKPPEITARPLSVEDSSRFCPVCRSVMQKRRVNSGAQAGLFFWVCADYPQCRSVVPVGNV